MRQWNSWSLDLFRREKKKRNTGKQTPHQTTKHQNKWTDTAWSEIRVSFSSDVQHSESKIEPFLLKPIWYLSMPQKLECLMWLILAEMSLVRQVHNHFSKLPRKGWVAAGRQTCLLQSEQSFSLLSARKAQVMVSHLQPWGAMVMRLGYIARENQDPNGKLLGRLKLLLHICPPLEKVLCAEVMKYCQRGKCSLLSKDPRASKWMYMVQQCIEGLESQKLYSPFMQRIEVRPCQRQLSWYLLARSWYLCPTSSNVTLMWKTKICTDSVRLALHSEVTHEDVVWFCWI